MNGHLSQVKAFLIAFQKQLCDQFEKHETSEKFLKDPWNKDNGAQGLTTILTGDVFEKTAVNFSHMRGEALPVSATDIKKAVANCPYEVVGVSVIAHPNNPYIPTTHLNLRYFEAHKQDKSVWWFGGGFDLTPYYLFEEDCVLWHTHAKTCCDHYDHASYAEFKKAADDYFYLPHRQEHRGIGGIFFDELNQPHFESCFHFIQSVGQHFSDAYFAIVEKRKAMNYTEAQKQFQCYRRGRYVEFNLLYDRGTVFGLQSKGRAESILASLPPLVRWDYQYPVILKNSAEEKLMNYILRPVEWV